jgi:hypothetical protein
LSGVLECVLYDEHDAKVGDGHAFTAAEAMALAWLNVWAPDALINGRVELDSVPFEVPPNWCFEVNPFV